MASVHALTPTVVLTMLLPVVLTMLLSVVLTMLPGALTELLGRETLLTGMLTFRRDTLGWKGTGSLTLSATMPRPHPSSRSHTRTLLRQAAVTSQRVPRGRQWPC
jgi:hypothetical protein